MRGARHPPSVRTEWSCLGMEFWENQHRLRFKMEGRVGGSKSRQRAPAGSLPESDSSCQSRVPQCLNACAILCNVIVQRSSSAEFAFPARSMLRNWGRPHQVEFKLVNRNVIIDLFSASHLANRTSHISYLTSHISRVAAGQDLGKDTESTLLTLGTRYHKQVSELR